MKVINIFGTLLIFNAIFILSKETVEKNENYNQIESFLNSEEHFEIESKDLGDGKYSTDKLEISNDLKTNENIIVVSASTNYIWDNVLFIGIVVIFY